MGLSKAQSMSKQYIQTLIVKQLAYIQSLVLGGVTVTSSAAELNILDGVTSTAAELNLVDNQVAGATFTIGAESGGNVINVGIQLTDAAGNDMAIRNSLPFYLSADANGDAIATAATSLAIGTDGLMIEWVSNSSGMLTSEADGDIDINVGDASGVATYYLVLVLPNGKLTVSAAITFA
jgi:hypothetical protein